MSAARKIEATPTARPILMAGAMVRATLEGRKTQTRRTVNPQPPTPEAVHTLAGTGYSWLAPSRGIAHWRPAGPVWAVRQLMKREPELRCPYGVPGDLLWVRETFALQSRLEDEPMPHDDGRPVRWHGDHTWTQPHYRATDPAPELAYEDCRRYCRDCEDGEPHVHWKPSIHMPRWASRLLLRVTDVRVERLQDISEADARAEGLPLPDPMPAKVNGEPGSVLFFEPRKAFAVLWDAINGSRALWASNPWIWAVSFERVNLQPKES